MDDGRLSTSRSNSLGAATFDDWDIYPRPSTDYVDNTVGVVLDPMAVHNYCIDDGNPECTEEEIKKIEVAYRFVAFWCGDTRAWKHVLNNNSKMDYS